MWAFLFHPEFYVFMFETTLWQRAEDDLFSPSVYQKSVCFQMFVNVQYQQIKNVCNRENVWERHRKGKTKNTRIERNAVERKRVMLQMKSLLNFSKSLCCTMNKFFHNFSFCRHFNCKLQNILAIKLLEKKFEKAYKRTYLIKCSGSVS